MKSKLITAAAIAALFSATAWAQMGPGMMGGHGPGGYGMGPGMMGADGPGMMRGYGGEGYRGLNLTDDQRAKIAAIREEFSRKRWDLMSKMHERHDELNRSGVPGKSDEASDRKIYQAMNDAHKAMFELSLDARKQIDAVFTKEQREQLRTDSHCG